MWEEGGGKVGSGECTGCGFMMVAVQELPGWRDVSKAWVSYLGER